MERGMRSVVVDKLASVTQACGLSHEVRISPDIPAEEGVVVVVEVLTNKTTYNTVELTSGRMAKVGKGDVIAGALGHRRALFGYSGHVPERLQPGDDLHLVWSHVALVEHSNLVLGLAQVEEQLLLVHGSAHLHERRTYSWIAALIHHVA